MSLHLIDHAARHYFTHVLCTYRITPKDRPKVYFPSFASFKKL